MLAAKLEGVETIRLLLQAGAGADRRHGRRHSAAATATATGAAAAAEAAGAEVIGATLTGATVGTRATSGAGTVNAVVGDPDKEIRDAAGDVASGLETRPLEDAATTTGAATAVAAVAEGSQALSISAASLASASASAASADGQSAQQLPVGEKTEERGPLGAGHEQEAEAVIPAIDECNAAGYTALMMACASG